MVCRFSSDTALRSLCLLFCSLWLLWMVGVMMGTLALCVSQSNAHVARIDKPDMFILNCEMLIRGDIPTLQNGMVFIQNAKDLTMAKFDKKSHKMISELMSVRHRCDSTCQMCMFISLIRGVMFVCACVYVSMGSLHRIASRFVSPRCVSSTLLLFSRFFGASRLCFFPLSSNEESRSRQKSIFSRRLSLLTSVSRRTAARGSSVSQR